MNSLVRSVGLAAGLVILSVGSSVFAQSVDVVATTTSGPVVGEREGAIDVFRGIPFAQAPVGDLRWREPQAVAPWTAPRSAKTFSPACMQAEGAGGGWPRYPVVSEDCLYLNVWTPAGERDGPRPVIVWIYGGGFVSGGAELPTYDGASFAEDDVVFVSLNYRVGRLGFFAHPGLTAEGGGRLGNYGYMDQIAALRWVQDNISAFGGDPGNVTIMGESAGGISVSAMMSSPEANGLFARAVIMSGAGRGLFGGLSMADAERSGEAFAREAGIDETGVEAVARLRALPAEDLTAPARMSTGPDGVTVSTFVGPVVDGTVLPRSVYATFATGRQAAVPVMVGATSADLGQGPAGDKAEIFAAFGDDAAAAASAYDPNGSATAAAISQAIGADRAMIEPSRFLAQSVERIGQPSWFYRFSYVAPYMQDGTSGAKHASEIPFLFETNALRYEGQVAPADIRMSEILQGYILGFARVGDPNAAERPRWTSYHAGSDQVLDFAEDGQARMTADPFKARLDVAESLALRSMAPSGD